jgi:hypothetical protein
VYQANPAGPTHRPDDDDGFAFQGMGPVHPQVIGYAKVVPSTPVE